MHIYIYFRVYVWVYVHIHICRYIYVHIKMFVYIYIYIDVYTYIYIHIYIQTCGVKAAATQRRGRAVAAANLIAIGSNRDRQINIYIFTQMNQYIHKHIDK